MTWYLDIPYITFFTTGRMDEFWQVVRVIMFVAMPLLLIVLAVEYGGLFISTIRNAFSTNADDDYEYRDRRKDYDR